MHELGVVFHVIDDVKKIATQNKASHINSVTIELGEVSAVVPDYLLDCWNWAVSKQEMMINCKLKIEMIPAVSFCEDCKKEYETVKFAKKCPFCGSENTYLLKGNEFTIKEIEVV